MTESDVFVTHLALELMKFVEDQLSLIVEVGPSANDCRDIAEECLPKLQKAIEALDKIGKAR